MRVAAVAVLALVAVGCASVVNPSEFTPLPWPHNQGGAVIHHVDLVPVFWNSETHSEQQSFINNWWCHVVQSNFIDALGQYGVRHGNKNCRSNYILSGTSDASTLTDATIQSTLLANINGGVLPPPSPNTYYAVHIPRNVLVDGGDFFGVQCGTDGSGSGAPSDGHCTYHSSFRSYSAYNDNIRYGVILDYSPGTECFNNGCNAVDSYHASFTYYASLNLAAGLTDPDDLGTALDTQPDYTVGWFDPHYGSITDICTGTAPGWFTWDSKNYTVANVWSNYAGNCVSHYVPHTTQYVTHPRQTTKTWTTTKITTAPHATTTVGTTRTVGTRRPRDVGALGARRRNRN